MDSIIRTNIHFMKIDNVMNIACCKARNACLASTVSALYSWRSVAVALFLAVDAKITLGFLWSAVTAFMGDFVGKRAVDADSIVAESAGNVFEVLAFKESACR
jgi:hypothetical protein